MVHVGDCIAWVVAGALFGICVGLGMRALFAVDIPALSKDGPIYLLVIFGVPWIVISQLTAEMIFVGLTSKQERSDQDREWFGRSSGWFAAIGLGWLVLVSLVVLGPILVQGLNNSENWPDLSKVAALFGALSGIISAVLGHGSATKAKSGEQGRLGLSFNVILAVTVPIFFASLVIGLSVGLDWLLIGGQPFKRWTGDFGLPTWLCLVLGLAGALVIGGAASWFVNINWFSLHGLYRNRLIRAFLGASCVERLPNPFTGFDQKDNPQVAELWPGKARPNQENSVAAGECCPVENSCRRPFQVINIAINLVSSKRLAWQERKAGTFTVTPLHSGYTYDSETSAYRPTVEYGHPKKLNPAGGKDIDRCGISLGTAMAISGAAASPNMGYHSSPLVTLVLALFNVRLGWWLGNPGEPGNRTFRAFSTDVRKVPAYQMESPKWALGPFINELFGATSENQPFVYLSDGGHFDNLGLYEMVRRRCKYIVVSDAGCDQNFSFEDLGNAVRKIWIDFGVKITFYGIHALRSRMEDDRQERQSGNVRPSSPQDKSVPLFAMGHIHYGQGDTKQIGYILYVKAAYNRSALRNVGVRSYAMAHPAFPHETTVDQFFSESQFESYRALGFEITDEILKKGADKLENRNDIKIGQIIERLWEDAQLDLKSHQNE